MSVMNTAVKLVWKKIPNNNPITEKITAHMRGFLINLFALAKAIAITGNNIFSLSILQNYLKLFFHLYKDLVNKGRSKVYI